MGRDAVNTNNSIFFLVLIDLIDVINLTEGYCLIVVYALLYKHIWLGNDMAAQGNIVHLDLSQCFSKSCSAFRCWCFHNACKVLSGNLLLRFIGAIFKESFCIVLPHLLQAKRKVAHISPLLCSAWPKWYLIGCRVWAVWAQFCAPLPTQEARSCHKCFLSISTNHLWSIH